MPPKKPPTREYYSVREAAARLGVTDRTITNWIASGRIKAQALNPDRQRPTWLIPAAELQRELDTLNVDP